MASVCVRGVVVRIAGRPRTSYCVVDEPTVSMHLGAAVDEAAHALLRGEGSTLLRMSLPPRVILMRYRRCGEA